MFSVWSIYQQQYFVPFGEIKMRIGAMGDYCRVKGEKDYKFSTLKNERIRVLTVAQEVMDVLRQQKEQQEIWAKAAGSAWNNADNLVFTNELGRFVANQALYRNYKSIVKKIGLGNLRFHDLRHPYVKHTTKKYSLQKQKSQATISDNLRFLFFSIQRGPAPCI